MHSTRIKWRDRTPENDIKYGGFLSYRHLRIIAWFCLIVAQIGVVLKLEGKLAPSTQSTIDAWNSVISVIGGLPVPLFLLANFSTILQKRGDYKSLFIRFGGLAVGLYLLANIIVFHYGFRSLLAIGGAQNWADAARFFGALLPLFGQTGYTLNIFIDMLLVVLMFFFINYEPQTKAFQGWRIGLFRAMFILPVAYEVGGIILKYFITMGKFTIPSPIFFLLPSKPPLIFIAFVIIVLGLKISEIAYIKRPGNSKESFLEHIKTKAHSLKISIGISAAFLAMALVDLVLVVIIYIVTSSHYAAAFPEYTAEQIEMLTMLRLNDFTSIGIGDSVGLVLAIPLVLLFSYTKQHKNPKIDLFIPIAGVALIALVLFEGTFQVITLNMPSFLDKLREAIKQFFGDRGEETPPEEAMGLLSWVRQIHL